jgi:D-glycero-D-manno-heptose 1,7-bisphosphate phosphatase
MSQKAIFLDRDDTIMEDSGYINSPQQVKLIPGAAGALVDLRKMGYKIIVVSNQSGIARGIITEQAVAQIHEMLKQLLAEQNAYLDRIYYCPYHPDGVISKFRKDSDWRKPKPGMLFAAAKEMSIDLAGSWMVGNGYRDVAAGKAAGCRTILIKSHTNMPVKQLDDPDADFEAINLKEAVNIVKREIMPKQNIEPVKPVVEPQQPEPVEIPAEKQKIQQSEFQSSFAKAAEDKPAAGEQKTEELETTEQKMQQPVSDNPGARTEQLLEDIKLLLKSRNRQEQYSDFSVLKLFAGVLQIVVPFCLVIALWYRMSPTANDGAVFTALGFAIAFQLMALTLYIMHNEK